MKKSYEAVVGKDGKWWIGWVEDVQGVNSQGRTKKELLENLRSAGPDAGHFRHRTDPPGESATPAGRCVLGRRNPSPARADPVSGASTS